MNNFVRKTVVGACCLVAATATGALAETLKVGAILAVTGPAAFLGAPEARTAEMFVEKINAAGGIRGNKLELIIKDSAASPEKAISFAKQLIEEDKVVAIIGPSTSGETMQIKKIAEEGKTPLISCAAAEVIVNPVAQYVFKTPQKDSDVAKMIFGEMKKMNIAKIAVVSSNDGFGKAGQAQLMEIAPQFGVEVLVNEVYDKAATDLTALVAKLKADKNIQAVVNWSIVPAQSIIAKNMRQAGWEVPLFQSHGFGNVKYVEAAGAAAEGIIFPAGRLLVADQLEDSHPQKALLLQYKKDYEQRFNEPVSTFGGHAYDALAILTAALEKAGSPERDKVRAAIEQVKELPGTAGLFSFSAEDHNGLSIDSLSMLTVKNGQFVFYQGK